MVDVTFMLRLTQPCRKGGKNQKIRMNEGTKGWGRDNKEMVKMVERVFQ